MTTLVCLAFVMVITVPCSAGHSQQRSSPVASLSSTPLQLKSGKSKVTDTIPKISLVDMLYDQEEFMCQPFSDDLFNLSESKFDDS